jgi:hypothetical protein
MSYSLTNTVRRVQDHFEPESSLDPQEQRKLRGHLEQIDYAAFAANQQVLAQAIGHADPARFQRMAVAAAQARARWVAAGVAMTESGAAPQPAQVANLTALRTAYEELLEVYEAMRRMVERGYLPYRPKP